MDEFNKFLERIFGKTDIKNQTELSKILGVNRSNITHAKRKGEVPESWVYKLSSVFNLNSEWLLTGQGEARAIAPDEYLKVPKVAARLSAGGGSFETEATIKSHFVFDREWLRHKGDPEKMVMMDVWGDSMSPELRDGDSVLIDQSKTALTNGTIFALGAGDAILIKRLEIRPNQLILRSENKAYEPIVLEGDEADSIRVLGKILWVCRNYK